MSAFFYPHKQWSCYRYVQQAGRFLQTFPDGFFSAGHFGSFRVRQSPLKNVADKKNTARRPESGLHCTSQIGSERAEGLLYKIRKYCYPVSTTGHDIKNTHPVLAVQTTLTRTVSAYRPRINIQGYAGQSFFFMTVFGQQLRQALSISGLKISKHLFNSP